MSSFISLFNPSLLFNHFILACSPQPAVCPSLALSTRVKLASAKHTGTSRRRLCPPSPTTTLSLNPSATVTTAARSHSATATTSLHPSVIAMTPTQSPVGAATSLFLRDDTATILRAPHRRAGSAAINSNRTTARRRTTAGTDASECTDSTHTLTQTNIHYTLSSLAVFCRWNPRSEHLQRKTYRTAGRTGSLDELEEFASCYKQKAGRGAERIEEDRGDYEMEFLEFSRYPSSRNGPPQHYHNDENELRDNREHDDHPRRNRSNGHSISPIPSPKKRRGTWDNELSVPPPPRVSPPSTSSQEKDYDGAFLNSLLDRKAKLRGVGQGRSGARGEGGSDTPSKGSSKKSSGESSRHCSRSPSNRPEADSLPPSSDTERSRTDRPSPRPLPAYARSPQSPALSLPSGREEPRDKSRKVVS